MSFSKFKQWANEKVGTSSKTQTTDEFQELRQRTDARHIAFDKLHVVTNVYLRSISKKIESYDGKTKNLPIETLGTTMRVYGEEIGSEADYGVALVNFGTANEKIANTQVEYISRIREEFLLGLEDYIKDLKHYQVLKKKLESRRLDYDSKLNRVQKSKKEKPELEEEMRAAKEKYEDTMDDITNKMLKLDESEDQYLRELTAFLDAELDYHKTCYDILNDVKKDWVESPPKRNVRQKSKRRKATSDSNNSNSDGGEEKNRHSDDDASIRSYSSYSRSKGKKTTSRRTSTIQKNSKSDNLSVPNKLTRSKSASSESSSVKSYDAINKSQSKKSGKSTTTTTTSSSPTSTSKKKQVKALYSYEGTGDDELTIEDGDIVTVLEEHEGWWIGEITDPDGSVRTGMFPANYTEEIKSEAPSRNNSNNSNNSYSSHRSSQKPTHSNTRESNGDESPPRSLSPPVSTPPIPSRSTKPSPSRNSIISGSQQLTRQKTNEYSSIAPKITSPTPSISRASYITQEHTKKTNSSQDCGPCQECGCDDFSPNVFKKDNCNNCFHKH
ncbi:10492_t:CDS:2 [Entrophospora sp. SA101]|nr:10492_t:CDS:2 [Entrophospora sp. SA101]